MSCLHCTNAQITEMDRIKCIKGHKVNIDRDFVEECVKGDYAMNYIVSKIGLSRLMNLVINEKCCFYLNLSDYEYNATDKLVEVFNVYEKLLKGAANDPRKLFSEKCIGCYTLQEIEGKWKCTKNSNPDICNELYEELPKINIMPSHKPRTFEQEMKFARVSYKFILEEEKTN